MLRDGYWADVAVFDPARIADLATYDDPHRYACGVSTVIVNGEVVVMTAATIPARFLDAGYERHR